MKEVFVDMLSEFKDDKRSVLYGVLVGAGLIGLMYIGAAIQYVYFL
jgi:hypothetical protein